jgi:hypothetical protein
VSDGNTLYLVSSNETNLSSGLALINGFGMLLRLMVRFLFRSMARALQLFMSLRISRTSSCLYQIRI